MKTIYFERIQIINMNKSSMLIDIGEYVFITRRNFNKLLHCGSIECVIVERRDLRGNPIKWVAVPSIF